MIEIPKNRREVIRVRKRAFRGEHLLDVRVFFPGRDGELRHSGKGVAVRIDLAFDLARAIEQVAAQERPDVD